MSEAALLAFAKESFRFKGIDAILASDAEAAAIHARVKAAVVRNVKMGPFTTTAKVELPYLLNASTSLMEKGAAADVCAIFGKVLPALALAAGIPSGERFIVVGMETAGGMMAAQLAVFAPASLPLTDYVYMRKTKKATGTGQQLEAVAEYTERTSASPKLRAIWVDDANSTGSSLVEGVRVLAADYNIEVAAALYIVDRSADRQNLPMERQKLASADIMGKVLIGAIFDLAEIDANVPKPSQK